MSTSMPECLTTPVALDLLIPSPEATALLPEAAARRLRAVPLAVAGNAGAACLVVACADPADQTLLERLARHLPRGILIQAVKAAAEELDQALDRCYAADTAGQLALQCETRSQALRLLRERPDCLIRLFEWVLLSARRQGASDIHLSPGRDRLHIRFRVDGVLRSFAVLSSALHSGLLVRTKILAGMDIAESRRPQDGQFTQWIDARAIDFRVSCFPTINGQNTVLRLLDPHRGLDSLIKLKLPTALRQCLSGLIQRPDGLVVVCGPTGSGKSTTLHALLAERDAETLNIMTLEDPVEQTMAGIRQSSIDAGNVMGYAEGVRGLLRQDPDVLLIGEIRDQDSCAMALRAVMSGHQVLTTIHANTAVSGLSRLIELGAVRSVLADNLLAIASQRLVRTLCSSCCESSSEACSHCQGSGFNGRQAIMELLVNTPGLARLITSGALEDELLALAREEGFVPLQVQGQALIDQGVSTAAELLRVLGQQSGQQPGQHNGMSLQGGRHESIHQP